MQHYKACFIANTAFVCHVTEDLHFAIMPVIGDSPRLEGYRVYNARTGELEEEDFTDLFEAKKYIEEMAA